MNAYQTIADTQDRVGESPVWDVRGQRLWWVDIEGAFIRSTVLGQTEAVQSWHLPERVGCIALTSVQGQLIAAMETGIARVTLHADGQVDIDWLARIQHPAPDMRFNDGRCDASGRLWLGTMVMDMSLASDLGGLYCLDERGLTGPHVTGLLTPNGLGMSPDGRTLYLSDSHPKVQKIWAFDLDAFMAEMAALLHRLRATRRLSLLLVSHDLAAIEAACNRGVWLNNGVVEMEGPVRPVLSAYRSAVEAAQTAPPALRGLLPMRSCRHCSTSCAPIRAAETGTTTARIPCWFRCVYASAIPNWRCSAPPPCSARRWTSPCRS